MRVGRIRPLGFDVDPAIDEAVDGALVRSGLEVTEVDLPHWLAASKAAGLIIDAEAAESNRALLDDPARRDLLGADVRARLTAGAQTTPAQLAQARAVQASWRESLAHALADVEVLALPTVPFYPPLLADARSRPITVFTNPVNLAGNPALALPVPSANRFPASLQLIGRAQRGPVAGDSRDHRSHRRLPASALRQLPVHRIRPLL